MTGWRVGYIAADKKLAKELIKFHQFVSVCGQPFAQHACAKLLENKKEAKKYTDNVISELKKLVAIITEFKSTNDIEMTLPQGGFYSFIKIPKEFSDAETFCLEILDKEHISLVPGLAFGDDYKDYYRLSFGSVDQPTLKTALEKIIRYYKN